jgi:hypothetical protein
MTAEPIRNSDRPGQDAIPAPFLNVRVHDLDLSPSLTAVCAGYEDDKWRAAGLARHILSWVPDFALRYSERRALDSSICYEQMCRAVRTVFGDRSIQARGEPGEILLHIVCRQVFKSDTVVNKVFFKTACNETVKGYDCIHIVHAIDGLELWLGEAKFYSALEDAIRDSVNAVKKHLTTDYLRSEFVLVTDKIDDNWPHAAAVRRLIHENVPIQDVFERITVPVLLAYDSPVVQAHKQVNAAFQTAFNAEVRQGWSRFALRCGQALPVTVRLFLAPMATKQALIDELDRRVSVWR